jgi:probable phosphoglycerate mutase
MTATRGTILLIRHATTDAVGSWLAGRAAGVSLNQDGRAQAERLRGRLSPVRLAAIYSSPLERAVETAEPVARDRGLRVEPLMDLMEIDFGAWTGARFDALAADPQWIRFNRHRSMASVPGGERAGDAQARIARAMDEAGARHPNQTIAFVTHADVIRLAVLHVAGAPIDFIGRFEISPASITAVSLHDDGATLLYINERT